MSDRLTYKDAGVDINSADQFVSRIKSIVKPTFRHEVLSGIGGFGSLFALKTDKYQEPVLVASTDGVGTKLRIAFMMDRHDTIGVDLVAMCVNDIIVQGAEPLFMLDYLATGALQPGVLEQVVQGVARGCEESGCSLVGGETAEMPSFYADGEYDLAGFVVGVVDKQHIVDGTDIMVGDTLIGIASSGIHSNGLSLARKVIFERQGLGVHDMVPEFGCTVGEELLRPTRIYVKSILNLLRDFRLHGMAHITGGGILDNLARILPRGCAAEIQHGSWPVPPLFRYLQQAGNIDNQEMLRTFNNGIGMVLVVHHDEVDDILLRLEGLHETGYTIGTIIAEEHSSGDRVIVSGGPAAL